MLSMLAAWNLNDWKFGTASELYMPLQSTTGMTKGCRRLEPFALHKVFLRVIKISIHWLLRIHPTGQVHIFRLLRPSTSRCTKEEKKKSWETPYNGGSTPMKWADEPWLSLNSGSRCMEWHQNVNTNKTVDLNTDRYGGHIELIRFKKYYGKPRGHEHYPIYSISNYARFSGQFLE